MSQAANLAALGSNAGSTGVLASAAMPAGSVLQVVTSTNSTQTSTTNSSYQASSLTVTITPKFANSKILINVSSTCTNTNSSQQSWYTIYRNGATNLGGGASNGLSVNQPQLTAGYYVWTPLSINYLDSPSTTSATSYTLYLAATGGSTAYVNWSNFLSTITAQEIAG